MSDREFIKQNFVTILEAARVGLNDADSFDSLAESLDMTDAEMIEVREGLQSYLNGENQMPDILHEQKIHDWRKLACPDELPESEDRAYNLKIETISPDQLDVSIIEEGAKFDGMGLFIEINNGIPCVHVTNDPFNDNVINLFSSNQGIIVQKENRATGVFDYPQVKGAVIYENKIEDDDEKNDCVPPILLV